MQRIDILPVKGDPPGFGLKSKTNKWFAYYYKTEEAAIKTAANIEAKWTLNDDAVNFSYKNPSSYVDR